jgi:hypothetical protein
MDPRTFEPIPPDEKIVAVFVLGRREANRMVVTLCCNAIACHKKSHKQSNVDGFAERFMI